MGSCGAMNGDQIACNGFHMIRLHNPHQLGGGLSPTWFDVRVFYVRVTNDLIDDSVPESLKINHFPMDPETLLEVNGTRCRISSDGLSSSLRRDRVDKKSEEVTFVSTDIVRLTGSVKFEVINRDRLVLSGVLELSCRNDSDAKFESPEKKWSLRCKSELVGCKSFLKAQCDAGSEFVMPVIEVYAAGCVSGAPIILTETILQHKTRKKKKKNGRKRSLEAIPEHETTDNNRLNAYPTSGLDLQAAEYRSYKMGGEEDLGFYYTKEYMEEEDGELSWFNAGVRVGVGIGLGVCLGVGLGAGLLLRTYKTASRTLRRR